MAPPFKLQSVLNYRRSLEDQARLALSRSLQDQAKIEAELNGCRKQLQNYDGQVQKRQREGLTIAELDLFETRISHVRALMEQYRRQLGQLAQRIEGEREDLIRAARERQVMEKLKEKQEAEYRSELDRKERALLDEISLRSQGEGL